MQLQVASPILGFEEITDFTLEKIDDYFYTLTHGEIVFTLIDPVKLRDYTFDLPPFYAQKLGAKDAAELLVLCIVIIQNPIEISTINFRAPVVINKETEKLVQVPLDEQYYPDFSLAEEIKRYL